MKKIFLKYIFGLVTLILATSCSLNEYNPVAGSTDEEVLPVFENWKAYQSNCYSGLHGAIISLTYGTLSELGTDLWTHPNSLENLQELMSYKSLTTTYNHVQNVWRFGWASIKDCNKTIELASEVVGGNPNDIKIIVAETRFLRAYYYLLLVQQFGELPLVLDPSDRNLSPKRNSVAEVYAQIVADLKAAAADLLVTPYDNNLQRATKKAALGLLARAYAQGAGEGLTEDGKTYWVRAKEVAVDLITNAASYGAQTYTDFSEVFASANNRNNKEVLFTAYGPNPYDASNSLYTLGKPNLYLHFYPKITEALAPADFMFKDVNSNTNNAYYGRLNQQFIAPTKYLIDCFDARYDKRWENTFVTAFTNYSGVRAIASLSASVPAFANITYAQGTVTLTAALCAKYGIDPSHAGKKIYPYADIDTRNTSYGSTWQMIPKIWTKGDISGNVSALYDISNANLHPYPLEVDENRFLCYLSKDDLTAADKRSRAYATININDLFDLATDATGATYKTTYNENSSTANYAKLWPAMMKFNHNFDGAWVGGNFQQKSGNIFIMRMAEVYLIAAEATIKSGGSGSEAAGYLNVLRERACRNASDFNAGTGMMLSTATIETVFDEYARELCGEFTRWALLKRHRAFETRLALYNKRAAANFTPKHYNRPIPDEFLKQINNAEEFGTNGY